MGFRKVGVPVVGLPVAPSEPGKNREASADVKDGFIFEVSRQKTASPPSVLPPKDGLSPEDREALLKKPKAPTEKP